MKSVGMGEAKKMVTFMALGGIAIASWYELKNFETWEDLEEFFKKTWCIKLNHLMPLHGHVRLFNVNRVTYKNTL